MMAFVGIPGAEWVAVADFSVLPGVRHPRQVLDRWLRQRGIDWLPFAEDEILWWEP